MADMIPPGSAKIIPMNSPTNNNSRVAGILPIINGSTCNSFLIDLPKSPLKRSFNHIKYWIKIRYFLPKFWQ